MSRDATLHEWKLIRRIGTRADEHSKIIERLSISAEREYFYFAKRTLYADGTSIRFWVSVSKKAKTFRFEVRARRFYLTFLLDHSSLSFNLNFEKLRTIVENRR